MAVNWKEDYTNEEISEITNLIDICNTNPLFNSLIIKKQKYKSNDLKLDECKWTIRENFWTQNDFLLSLKIPIQKTFSFNKPLKQRNSETFMIN